jgi:diadenylate cyclase
MQDWNFGVVDIIDISLVAVLVYFALRLIRGTRAVQMLIGLTVFVVVYELARFFGLLTVEWIFSQFFSAFIIILVVLFQHEIRRALMRLGANPLASGILSTRMVDALVEAAFALTHCKWGGLMVIERETGLKHLFDSGVEMDAPVRSDVLQALFCPLAPMHDGAVVIQQPHAGESGRIVAARVLLPLAQANATALSGEFGTRHRAAIGLTEESDALVIVVSEETGHVRLANGGEMSDVLDANGLRQLLISRFSQHPEGSA